MAIAVIAFFGIPQTIDEEYTRAIGIFSIWAWILHSIQRIAWELDKLLKLVTERGIRASCLPLYTRRKQNVI